MSQQSVSDARNSQVYRVWAVYVAVGMVLALTLPLDVISTNSLIAAFTASMSEIVPSIDKASSVSRFPEVTRTYFSVMWAIQPLVTIFSVLRLRWTPKKAPLTKLFWVTFIGMPLVGLLLYVIFAFPGEAKIDHSYTSGRGKAFFTIMSNSRLMLGLIGGVLLWTSMAFQYCFLIAYPRTFIHQFSSKDKS